ncbi:hypothetical protein F4779DRAFT_620111 [Xylariaceae sp. FL0662B]|nr:hypothetical protein F4779DRAFT_620111 [Xylariaceae sp. FL0662B]
MLEPFPVNGKTLEVADYHKLWNTCNRYFNIVAVERRLYAQCAHYLFTFGLISGIGVVSLSHGYLLLETNGIKDAVNCLDEIETYKKKILERVAEAKIELQKFEDKELAEKKAEDEVAEMVIKINQKV